MPSRFEPRRDILPAAQNEIWKLLAPAKELGFVLYGGTAVALYFGHRVSIDFDFFNSAPIDKTLIDEAFDFVETRIVQEARNTVVLAVRMPAGAVKLSFL